MRPGESSRPRSALLLVLAPLHDAVDGKPDIDSLERSLGIDTVDDVRVGPDGVGHAPDDETADVPVDVEPDADQGCNRGEPVDDGHGFTPRSRSPATPSKVLPLPSRTACLPVAF